MRDCVFCKIVSGDVPGHKVWEDESHLAFLSIFPEVEGMTIVIPKKHHPSYAFSRTPEDVLLGLICAAKEAAKLLDANLDGVIRTRLVFEGLEIDHLHVKLYPYYKNKKQIPASEAKQEDPQVLAALAQKIRGES